MRTSLTIAACLLLAILIAAWALWTPDKDRGTLERSYLAAPGDMRSVLGVNLHVRDSGPRDAPAVLLLHGFGASLHTWEPWALGLSRDMRVIRIDLPGNGLSSPDPTGDYTDQRTMALLLALLDQLQITQTSVVGHSIGGRIAWTFAATYPQRVAKLVLVAPDGFASPGFGYGKAPEVPAVVQWMRFTLPRWLLRRSLEAAYADTSALTDAMALRYHDLMRGPGARAAMIARMQQTVLVDPVPLLRRIQAPTLVLWGRQDGMIPFGNSADYTQAIANNRLVALEAVGHLPHEEAPDRSLVPVRDFLLQP
jgi:pimeloyl-ACP methyl ester carboxylesterase